METRSRSGVPGSTRETGRVTAGTGAPVVDKAAEGVVVPPNVPLLLMLIPSRLIEKSPSTNAPSLPLLVPSKHVFVYTNKQSNRYLCVCNSKTRQAG